jgi:hypothetical protein
LQDLTLISDFRLRIADCGLAAQRAPAKTNPQSAPSSLCVWPHARPIAPQVWGQIGFRPGDGLLDQAPALDGVAREHFIALALFFRLAQGPRRL